MPDPIVGPLAAAELVAARLADPVLGIPAWWSTLQGLAGYGPVPNGLEDNQRLPAPRLYGTEEQVRLEPEQYPAAITLPQRTASFAPAEPGDDGRPRWRVGYQIRTLLFVRGTNNAECSAGRFRLVVATRAALVAKPRLTDFARIEVASFTESYSDVDVLAKDQSTISGSWADVIVLVDEVLPDPPIGQALDVGATVGRLA